MYKGSFFSRRYKLSWRVPFVCDAICKVLDPIWLIDIGCGIGDYVKGFIERGVRAEGVEGSENCTPFLVVPERLVRIVDMRKELIFLADSMYDMVLCLEMLEHIEEEYADIVVSNLSSMTNKILTSAAPPGQGGHYHVNCRPKEYWVEMFSRYKFTHNRSIVDAIRKEWEPINHKKEMSAYYKNLMYFERE
jgi:hypothetical protein